MEDQQSQIERMKTFGWSVTGQVARKVGIEGDAVVMTHPGNVAVVYPNGMIDRPVAGVTENKIKFLAGWIDVTAQCAEAVELERVKASLIEQFSQPRI